ncbi:MAG: hypothetical protein WC009_12675 [Methylotenera sp.]
MSDINHQPTIFNKIFSDTTLLLALTPFAFTLIVFMYQIGKFFFYDIPLQHISISLGQLFSFWFGFFIAVGLIGFGLIDLLIGMIFKYKLGRLFEVLFFEAFVLALIIFLLLFPIAPLENTLVFTSIAFSLMLISNLIDAGTNKNKQLSYLERIESNHAQSKYKKQIAKSFENNLWEKLSERYYLGFFCVYVILGVPCKIGYLLESTETKHWVDGTKHGLILVQAQNDFHLLKEYDPTKKVLKNGYIVRPISNNDIHYYQVETGRISKL